MADLPLTDGPSPATREGLGTVELAIAERRCWRCLCMFPGDGSGDAPVRAEFWLCRPCEAVLMPSKRRAIGDHDPR